MKKIKVGYLPLYIKLYDDSNPHYRDPMVDYMHMLIKMLESQGLEVVLADEVCRIKPEFDRAAKKFNDAGVSAVITQHLAYSPSLESIEALLSLDAPIIVFDTTPDYQLLKVSNYKGCISANHGIHGVQDMCNLLKRNGKPYYLCVGHALHSEVVSEVVGMCRAAAVKKAFQTEKVGSVGGSFTGMGDFLVSDERYKNDIGVEVQYMTTEVVKEYLPKVTEEEISRIVARWTGIPVAKLMEGEREKLLHLEDILHRRVIGQDEAVTKVSDAILRSRAGIRDPKRPIGSFLFLGPTGVGKTELAKALAEALFDDEHNIVRIDMSEYMEKYSVSRLIGAPPGYVGYEEGGQLTEAVRRRPYSVVLFDEVEKAHPDVFNVLLQVLDDGRITDSQGRTVDFKNTIIILTSNLGSDLILEGIGENGEISEEARDGVTQLLRRSFRPEFLNRLDEIVFYKPLTKENIRGIVDLLVADLQKRMAQRQLTVTLTDAAKDYLIAKGYDPIYGARPLKRLIQTEVETLLARWIIAEDPAPETAITVDYDGEKLVAM